MIFRSAFLFFSTSYLSYGMEFKINYLDHVAIRVKDMANSISWYERVLGLKKVQLEEWGAFPIFMLAEKTGIALFPADEEDPNVMLKSSNVKIEHFAFNVSNEDFILARKKYDLLQIKYRFQDHYYFHSIYTFDPDGHEVELTTVVVPENGIFDL